MEMREAGIIRDPRNESLTVARQAFAEQTAVDPAADAGNQKLFKRSRESASARSDPQTTNVSKVHSAISGNRMPLDGWALRGIAGVLLAAGIGAAIVAWSRSSGDAARTTPSQPAPLAQTASTAAVSPEMMPLLQSMARDLTSAGKEIELLKTGRETMVRENAKLNEQLRAGQEELTRTVGQLSEQLKATQEQLLRDNANAAEQTRRIQDQLARVISEASEQNTRLRTVAAPPRPAAPATRKPVLVPTALTPQAPGQPKPEKPRLSSTSRPLAPAR